MQIKLSDEQLSEWIKQNPGKAFMRDGQQMIAPMPAPQGMDQATGIGKLLLGLSKPFRAIGAGVSTLLTPDSQLFASDYKNPFLTQNETNQMTSDPAKFGVKQAVGLGAFLVPGGSALQGVKGIGQAALRGGVAGGLTGFGQSENGNELQDVLTGAATGGIAGGALQGLSQGLQSLAGKKVLPQNEGWDAWKIKNNVQTDELGNVISGSDKVPKLYPQLTPETAPRGMDQASMTYLANDVGSVLEKNGIKVASDNRVFQDINNLLKNIGKRIEETNVDAQTPLDLNKIISFIKSTPEYSIPEAQKVADKFIESLTKNKIVYGPTGEAIIANPTINAGDAWRIVKTKPAYSKVATPASEMNSLINQNVRDEIAAVVPEIRDLNSQYSVLARYRKVLSTSASNQAMNAINKMTGLGASQLRTVAKLTPGATEAFSGVENTLQNVLAPGINQAGQTVSGYTKGLGGIADFLSKGASPIANNQITNRTLPISLSDLLTNAGQNQPATGNLQDVLQSTQQAIPTAPTTTDNTQKRSQLFMKLLQQGASPSEAKTMVDMVAPEPDKLASAAQSKVSAIDGTLSQLNGLENYVKNNPSRFGLVQGRVKGLEAKLGADPEQSALEQTMALVAQSFAKSMDPTLSAKDREYYTNLLPNTNKSSASVLKGIESLRNYLLNQKSGITGQ